MIGPSPVGTDFKSATPMPKGKPVGKPSQHTETTSVDDRSSDDFSAPKTKVKETSSANASSDRPINNSSGFSGTGEFKTMLKGRLDPAEKPTTDKSELDLNDSPDLEDGATQVPQSELMQEPVFAPKTLLPKGQFQQPVTPPDQMFASANSVTHRLAWTSFVHQMKEKFGVSASRILAAFKSLTPQELQQPPMQNVAKLVAQLGLNDQQAAVAQQLFKELIVKTDARTSEGELRAMPDQATLAMMSQREMSQARTEQALNQMNRQFFMKGVAPKAPMPEPQADAQTPIQDKRATGQLPLPLPTPTPTTAEGMAIPEGMTMVEPTETEAPTAPKGPLQKMAPAKPAARMIADAEEPQVPTTPQNFVFPKNPEKIPTPVMPQMAPAASVATATPVNATPVVPIPVAPKPFFSGAPDRNMDDSEDASGKTATADGDDAVPANVPFTVSSQASAEGVAPKLTATQPMAMPVHDLVQQAHVMIKDGGGEMRVVLQPEGLGEVVMKVVVSGGKVNVQAITQSDDAKRILESGFRSLKEGLNVHHLNLEGIKVDTMQSLGKQLDQQYQDAQRQQARQFLEQFHQGNQGYRQAFFDIPGAELYRTQSKSRPDLGSGAGAQRTNSNSSRRLDLVA